MLLRCCLAGQQPSWPVVVVVLATTPTHRPTQRTWVAAATAACRLARGPRTEPAATRVTNQLAPRAQRVALETATTARVVTVEPVLPAVAVSRRITAEGRARPDRAGSAASAARATTTSSSRAEAAPAVQAGRASRAVAVVVEATTQFPTGTTTRAVVVGVGPHTSPPRTW